MVTGKVDNKFVGSLGSIKKQLENFITRYKYNLRII